MFAVTIGGAYLGIIGMFLGVPLIVLIKVIIEDFIAERNIAKDNSQNVK